MRQSLLQDSLGVLLCLTADLFAGVEDRICCFGHVGCDFPCILHFGILSILCQDWYILQVTSILKECQMINVDIFVAFDFCDKIIDED